MSTRSVITFYDHASGPRNLFHIYKHSDGYPYGKHGIVQAIKNAEDYAWPLPRFEAGEYAAAFVAANKEGLPDATKRQRDSHKNMPDIYHSLDTPEGQRQMRHSIGGNIYLTTGPDAHSDREYEYRVGLDRKKLTVTIRELDRDVNKQLIFIEMFRGSLEDALIQFKEFPKDK